MRILAYDMHWEALSPEGKEVVTWARCSTCGGKGTLP